MKKIVLLFAIMFALPTFASCPIKDGGVCTASNWDSTPLQEKYAPNKLQDIHRTDAFKPQYVTPYRDMLINTETGFATGKPPASEYNSNCQFGVCLPGNSFGGEVEE